MWYIGRGKELQVDQSSECLNGFSEWVVPTSLYIGKSRQGRTGTRMYDLRP